MSVFYKMTGSGNDFIVLDGDQEFIENWPEFRIRAVCDRRLGVGADGLLLLNWEHSGQVSMRYFNSDGSTAPVCGNALLCTARLTALLRRDQSGQVDIKTQFCTFRAKAALSENQVQLTWPLKVTVREVRLIEREQGEEQIFLGDVGVPHLCVFVSNIQAVNVQKRGQALRFHPQLGTAGANINFVCPTNGLIHAIRTYERGIEAETYACVTGSLVCAVALVVSGRSELPIIFRTHSGRLIQIEGRINANELEDSKITGEAQLVFTGVITDTWKKQLIELPLH